MHKRFTASVSYGDGNPRQICIGCKPKNHVEEIVPKVIIVISSKARYLNTKEKAPCFARGNNLLLGQPLSISKDDPPD